MAGFVVAIAGASCGANLPGQASHSYRQQRDYPSLEILYASLRLGMSRDCVERLLGDPDYSPIEGQVYYSSTRQQDGVTIGLVLGYRTEAGEVTDRLKELYVGPIGE